MAFVAANKLDLPSFHRETIGLWDKESTMSTALQVCSRYEPCPASNSSTSSLASTTHSRGSGSGPKRWGFLRRSPMTTFSFWAETPWARWPLWRGSLSGMVCMHMQFSFVIRTTQTWSARLFPRVEVLHCCGLCGKCAFCHTYVHWTKNSFHWKINVRTYIWICVCMFVSCDGMWGSMFIGTQRKIWYVVQISQLYAG